MILIMEKFQHLGIMFTRSVDHMQFLVLLCHSAGDFAGEFEAHCPTTVLWLVVSGVFRAVIGACSWDIWDVLGSSTGVIPSAKVFQCQRALAAAPKHAEPSGAAKRCDRKWQAHQKKERFGRSLGRNYANVVFISVWIAELMDFVVQNNLWLKRL